jgi:hypothetical protein
MSEERAIDLRALDAASGDVVHEAVRTFRRRTLLGTVWIVVFGLAIVAIVAGRVVAANRNIVVKIAEGAYYNGTEGDYTAAGTDVGLVKVTRVSGDRWGLQFILRASTATGRCCAGALQPRGVTEWQTDGESSGPNPRFVQVYMAVPIDEGPRYEMAFVNDRGTSIGSFSVDLAALDVAAVEGS